MNAIVSYITGSLEELRQVRWPTQQQAIRLTVIVIGFIAVTAAAFGLIDGLLTQIIRWTF